MKRCLLLTLILSTGIAFSFNSGKNQKKVFKDTLYTLKESFIEIDLSKQMGYFVTKDSIYEFKISSGNKNLYKGIETKEGIFVIQSKAKKIYSRQFDSTAMLNWMGFNFGIGFHALYGNSYYKYLGEKKSSHGCLRISREDAETLFPKVEYGTPVHVHSGRSAVKLAFGNPNEKYFYLSFTMLKDEIHKRLQALYHGNYYSEVRYKLIIGRGNIFHSGLPIGNSDLISPWQIHKPWIIDVSHLIEKHVKVNLSPDSVKVSGINFPRLTLD